MTVIRRHVQIIIPVNFYAESEDGLKEAARLTMKVRPEKHSKPLRHSTR
jgi:hypothetical protein